MKVQILAFGVTRELIGKNSFDFTVEGASTIGDIKQNLIKQYPALGKLTALAFAVNSEYEQEGFFLKDGDELALIPPVSGG